jgi:hypothetical protein
MKVTVSNNRFMTWLLIAYIAIRVLMVFVPFTMYSSGISFQERLISFSYPTFAVHFIAEAIYWVIFLYMIEILKFIGSKMFVIAAFYILFAVEAAFFATYIYNFFWPGFMAFYDILEPLSEACVLYLLIIVFWIKNPVVAIPYRIYGFSIVFTSIVQQLYLHLVLPGIIQSGGKNPYEHLIRLLGLIPDISLLYIIIKANMVISEKSDDNTLVTGN